MPNEQKDTPVVYRWLAGGREEFAVHAPDGRQVATFYDEHFLTHMMREMFGLGKFERIQFANSTVETVGDISLDGRFWDCECPDKEIYIHPKSETRCDKCGALQEDQPDSRTNEVAAMIAKEDSFMAYREEVANA